MISIDVVPVGRPDILALLAQGERLMASLYPGESNHMISATDLAADGVTLVAACLEGEAVATGALVRQESGYAELKRIFVRPDMRGRGIARRILSRLERVARTEGLILRLEVGTRQPEALALYRAVGFRDIGPFGGYAADPLSVFMAKDCREEPA